MPEEFVWISASSSRYLKFVVCHLEVLLHDFGHDFGTSHLYISKINNDDCCGALNVTIYANTTLRLGSLVSGTVSQHMWLRQFQ